MLRPSYVRFIISFQWICLPFCLINENVQKITDTSDTWLGELETHYSGQWIDSALLLVRC